MKWNDVAQNWPAFVPRIMTRWPELNEDDLLAMDGQQEAFLRYLGTATQSDAVTAKAMLDEWLMGEQPTDAMMHPTRDNARISASSNNVPPGEDPLDDDRRFGDDQTPEPPIARPD